jgi:hypothetical protein
VTRHGFEESVGSALWREQQRRLRAERLERERRRDAANATVTAAESARETQQEGGATSA